MGRLDGLRTFVTGSTSGIGLGVATGFKAEGAKVAFNSERPFRDCDSLHGLAAPREYHQFDFASLDGLNELIDRVGEQLGGIDVLVLNAGIYREPSFLDVTPEIMTRTMTVNFMAPVLLTRAWAKKCLAMSGGVRPPVRRAIFTTSINAILGEFAHTVYDASKAALNRAIGTMSLELAAFGITTVGISVGLADTPLTHAFVNDLRVRPFLQSLIPLGVTQIGDLVPTYVHYASQQAGPVTGCIIPADGGISAAQVTTAVDIAARLGMLGGAPETTPA